MKFWGVGHGLGCPRGSNLVLWENPRQLHGCIVMYVPPKPYFVHLKTEIHAFGEDTMPGCTDPSKYTYLQIQSTAWLHRVYCAHWPLVGLI